MRIVEPHLVDSVVVQTSAAANTFLLAMLLYPEVQQRAQKEIDSVVGVDRLPDFKDRQYLPYVDALLKEVLRWHSPTPLGLFVPVLQSILAKICHTSSHAAFATAR